MLTSSSFGSTSLVVKRHYYVETNRRKDYRPFNSFLLPFTSSYFLLLVLLLSLWVHREPSFLYSLSLFKDFKDTPKARATDNSKHRTEYLVLNKQRRYKECQSCQKEPPPTFHSEIVFALDDNGMKNTYNKKCRNCNYNTYKVHVM